MNKIGIIASCAFIVGCLALGLCVVRAVNVNKSYDRTVSVRGLCEKEVMADKVIWPLTFKLAGNSLTDLYKQTDSCNEKIVNFLVGAGIDRNEISVGTPSITDNYATTYNNSAKYNYVISSVITVCTDDVPAVLKTKKNIGSLVEQGVPVGTGDGWNPTVYSYNGLNDIKPGMIEEATQNARAAAEKFANDSRSKLGKIKTATQGQFSISDRDSNTPYIKTVRVVTNVVYYLSD